MWWLMILPALWIGYILADILSHALLYLMQIYTPPLSFFGADTASFLALFGIALALIGNAISSIETARTTAVHTWWLDNVLVAVGILCWLTASLLSPQVWWNSLGGLLVASLLYTPQMALLLARIMVGHDTLVVAGMRLLMLLGGLGVTQVLIWQYF
ncbi:MAG: hypothetical protein COY40_03705 [Alphaproteobacteria bacterium CG_4_10_14_0_8_um_filter_53_9]|nr:MAG: hypothetical protein COY40_03705 [Alphaproteobacteria bacterium CG_4_10_14_0_8_um_filter_53_9]